MDQARVQQAAQLLWNAWQDGRKIERLPDAYRPQTIEEGYAVQAMLATCSGQSVSGWKIAATSQAGQAHIGVDGPLAGRLLAEKISRSPATLSLSTIGMRVVELEFAFRLAQDLPPRGREYSTDEVMASVASLHPWFRTLMGTWRTWQRFQRWHTPMAPWFLQTSFKLRALFLSMCKRWELMSPPAPATNGCMGCMAPAFYM